jgi:hypothetical protein
VSVSAGGQYPALAYHAYGVKPGSALAGSSVGAVYGVGAAETRPASRSVHASMAEGSRRDPATAHCALYGWRQLGRWRITGTSVSSGKSGIGDTVTRAGGASLGWAPAKDLGMFGCRLVCVATLVFARRQSDRTYAITYHHEDLS